MVFAKSLIGLVFLSLVATSAVAGVAQLKEPVTGTTEPPIGFVEFCERQPADCTKSTSSIAFNPTKDQWKVLRWINAMVNESVAPKSDELLYGQEEFWSYPELEGDCEDYALLKMRHLIKWGIPQSALRLTVVIDENGGNHAVLSLLTKTKDFVLDNRRPEIVVWNETGYNFLMRQPTGENQMVWENLMSLNFASVAN